MSASTYPRKHVSQPSLYQVPCSNVQHCTLYTHWPLCLWCGRKMFKINLPHWFEGIMLKRNASQLPDKKFLFKFRALMTKQPHLYHINNSKWNFIFFQYIFVRKNIYDIYWHCIELQISRALWLRIFIEMLACCRYWMPPRCQTPARGTDVSVRTLRGRSSSVHKRNVFAKRGNSSHQRKKHAIITSCRHCKMNLFELRNNGWVFLTWDMSAFKSFKHCHIYNSVIVL